MSKFEVRGQLGRGLGLFATCGVSAGEVVLSEPPWLVAPKQGSAEAVCVQCCGKLSSATRVDCRACGLPLCQSCEGREQLPDHDPECQLLKSAGKKFAVQSEKDVQRLHQLLGPLRMAQKFDCPAWRLQDNLASREQTLIHCLNELNAVRPILRLFANESPVEQPTGEDVHRACGILDTNAYEAGWGSGHVHARALYATIARINHDCVPNCSRSFRGDDRRMVVTAARDIAEGEEVTLSYTPSLLSTPQRQVLLQSTKHFVCRCSRCQDPSELGTMLSALSCPLCTGGSVLPEEPTSADSNYKCQDCGEIREKSSVQLQLDAAMRFVGHQGKLDGLRELGEAIQHLSSRILTTTHHLVLDLKMGFIQKVLEQASCERNSTDVQKAKEYCSELLTVSSCVSPGLSTIRGTLSKYWHQLGKDEEDRNGYKSAAHNSILVLTQDEISHI